MGWPVNPPPPPRPPILLISATTVQWIDSAVSCPLVYHLVLCVNTTLITFQSGVIVQAKTSDNSVLGPESFIALWELKASRSRRGKNPFFKQMFNSEPVRQSRLGDLPPAVSLI